MQTEASITFETLVDLLRGQAAEHGERQAYVYLNEDFPESQLTFAELEQKARAIAARLQQEMSPGDRALLVYPAGLEFVAAFFGCLFAGVVAVPATYPKPRRPLPRMNRIAEDCGATVALTTSQTLETLDRAQMPEEVSSIHWVATDAIRGEDASSWVMPNISPSHLAFLQYTSGSTSDPKGVMVTHANLLSNLAAIRCAFGIGDVEEDRLASTGVFWLPAYHDMGLIGGILTPLYVGGRSVLMSPTAFLQRPVRWLQAIDKYEASISGAPNFAYDYCVRRTTPEERAESDLSRWRLAFCGAEPIRAETLENFSAAFARAGFSPRAFYPCYGLAESTLLAAGPDYAAERAVIAVNRGELADHRVALATGESTKHLQYLVGCGHAMLNHRLLIVDPESNFPCDENMVGEVLVQGPSIAQGYWNDAEETERVFRAKVAGEEGIFLRTGDLGFIRDGQLYVTGRLKDVIIIRGRNHYPQDIEHTAEHSNEALLPGAAFAVSLDDEERLVIVNQVDRQYRKADWDEVVRAIRRSVAEHHELEPYAIVLIRQSSLPMTSSGKIQRNLCREQFLADELKVVHRWTSPVAERRANGRVKVDLDGSGVAWSSNGKHRLNGSANGHADAPKPRLTSAELDRLAERIEGWMLKWLIDRVGLEASEVERDKPFAEYGVDSLTAVELSQELEDEFEVTLTPIVAWNYPTPMALARYLAEQTGGIEHHDGAADDSSDESVDSLLAEIEGLSDEDAARLLAEEERRG
jgi:acyl-CoA synthetase (AMP-forming)/AMP-acid ligase II/acyl carrier protein